MIRITMNITQTSMNTVIHWPPSSDLSVSLERVEMAGPPSASNYSLSSAMEIPPSSRQDQGEHDEEHQPWDTYSTPIRPYSGSNDSGITQGSLLSGQGEQLSVGEGLKDIRDQHRQTDRQIEQLMFTSNARDLELRASQKKNAEYESALDTITSQLFDLLKYQSSMIEQYQEEKKRTTHILETVLRVRPSSNDGRHSRALSDESTYSRKLHSQMSQRPRSCSPTSALKEAAEEALQDKDSLLQQGLVHQRPVSGRRASAHDNRPLPEITSRRQPMVSPPPNHSSISFPGVPDDPGETQGPPKSPPAHVLDEPGGDDVSRRRPSSAKEGGITRNKSPPIVKPGNVYTQSVFPKKLK